MDQTPAKKKKKPAPQKRQRPLWEMALVWGGILLLLVVVGMEVTSQRYFKESLDELEETLGRGRLPLADIAKHTHGLALRHEVKQQNVQFIRLRWPSLFKKYELWLSSSDGKKVSEVTTESFSDKKRDNVAGAVPSVDSGISSGVSVSSRPAMIRKRGLKGLPQGYENVVAMPTLETDAPGPTSLFRETIRQSILIAARNELGLSTIDPSLGEVIPTADAPTSFPLEIDVTYLPQFSKPTKTADPGKSDVANGPPPMFDLVVTFSRQKTSQDYVYWNSPKIALDRDVTIEQLIERISPHTKTTFVDGLLAVGYTKAARRNRAPERLQEERLNRFDFASQFAAARDLQLLAEQADATPEVLGGLVRAYTNLGSITEQYWHCLSKVFKARALIYAQRLGSQAHDSPFALAHKAYAYALAGRHRTALEHVKAAKTASGGAAPEWLDLIENFCLFRPEEFNLDRTGKFRELVAYLDLRMVDADADVESALKAFNDFLGINPAGSRGLAIFGIHPPLGVQDEIVGIRIRSVWPGIYRSLAAMPGLPDSVRVLAKVQAEKKWTEPPQTREERVSSERKAEHQTRFKLIESLEQATSPGTESGYPSWVVLARILREESFLDAWTQLSFLRDSLGVEVDPLIDDLKPIFDKHELATYVLTFQSNHPAALQAAYGGMRPNIDPNYLEQPAFAGLLKAVHVAATWGSTALLAAKRIALHVDSLYNDQLALTRWNKVLYTNPEHIQGQIGNVYQTSEHWPEAVSTAISADWSKFARNAAQLESKYEGYPVVQWALANQYEQHKQPDAALRCLKKAVEHHPTFDGFNRLADFYRRQEEFDEWQQTLEKALLQPTFGLEAPSVHWKLADHFMRRGNYQQAEPHAMEAARSYAGWGLITAARCEEGLGKWQVAEQLMQALGMRYEATAPDWYFWCVRTGRGDQTMAKQYADAYWATNPHPAQREAAWKLVVNEVISNDLKSATSRLGEINKTWDVPIDEVIGIVFTQKLNDVFRRDSFFSRLEEIWIEDNPVCQASDMLRELIRTSGPVSWDTKRFDSLLCRMREETIPLAYYAAGTLLGMRDQKELSKSYLQAAATSYDGNNHGAMLATLELRSQKIKVGERRNHSIADDIEPACHRINQANRAFDNGDSKRAMEIYDEVIKSQPEFLAGYFWRAAWNESEHNYAAAIADYQEIIRLAPNWELPHSKIAWILATCQDDAVRNGAKALEEAETASKLRLFETRWSTTLLAVANAECGNFDKAEEIMLQVHKLSGGDKELQGALKLFREKKPYRQITKKADSN